MTYDPEKHRRHSIRLRGYDYARAGAYFVTICAQDRQCLFGEIRGGEMHLNDAGRMVERWWHELHRKFPGIQTDAFVVMPNHVHGIVIITAANVGGADRDDRNVDVNAGGDAIDTGDDVTDAGDDVTDVGDDVTDVGGYADPPLRNDNDVSDVGNANIDVIDDKTTVGADLHIRPRRIPNDHNANIDDRPNDNDGGINNDNTMVGADLHIRPRRIPNDHNANIDDRPNNIDDIDGTGASLSEIVQWFKIMTTNEYIRGVKQSGWPPFRKRIWQRNYYEHIIRDDEALARIRQYILDNPTRWEEKE